MIYFVIRKYKSEYSEDYRIEKHSNNHAEANKFLAALSLLEENENVEFFVISKIDDTLSENAA
mgnify:FL=1|jgi:hypothetical protein